MACHLSLNQLAQLLSLQDNGDISFSPDSLVSGINTDKIANYNYKRSAVFILFDGVKNTDTHKKNTDKQSKQAFNRINNWHLLLRKGQPQSNNYQKARKRYARKHLRVSRQRKGFVEKEALRVIKSNDFIAQVNLNIQGMVKNSRLAK